MENETTSSSATRSPSRIANGKTVHAANRPARTQILRDHPQAHAKLRNLGGNEGSILSTRRLRIALRYGPNVFSATGTATPATASTDRSVIWNPESNSDEGSAASITNAATPITLSATRSRHSRRPIR